VWQKGLDRPKIHSVTNIRSVTTIVGLLPAGGEVKAVREEPRIHNL
jgi:hypothetical protein